jgi:glycosyltransferase involved in cell wall biosynthesis
MNVLVISHPCSTAINQDFFARAAERGRWNVTIVVPDRWRNSYGLQVPRRWDRFTGELIRLPVLLPGNIPLHLYRRSLRAVILREVPDAIYVHHEPYALATFQAVMSNALSARSPIGFYAAQNIPKRRPWPIGAIEQYVYRQAAFALAVSEDASNVVRDRGFKRRLEVLPLGVDCDFYTPPQTIDERSQQAPLTVGFVGRLTESKGVDTLIDALAILRRDSVVNAIIVGDGPSRSALEKRAASLGLGRTVSWLGYVAHDQMPHIYRMLDLLVLPSRSTTQWKEQFGRVVIESLACGVPVVASNSGELPLLLSRTDGGWIFPEGDSRFLAGTISDLYMRRSELRQRGLQAREAVKRLFNIDDGVERFVQVVGTAISRGSSSKVLARK